MAVDTERLLVQLEARLDNYEGGLRKAKLVAGVTADAIAGRFRKMESEVERSSQSSARKIAAGLTLVGSYISAREVLEYADKWKKANNALKVAGVSGAELAPTLEKLYQIAQGSSTPLNAVTTLYGKLSQSSKELGASQEQLFAFTKGVGDALKVNGTSATEASGALLQLSQALGAGIVRAEEFNSLGEGANPILQTVAKRIEEAGGSVSKLKNLVNEGRLTSKQFFDAFLQGTEGLAAQAAEAETTFTGVYTKIENALIRYIGRTDEGLGASQRLIAGLSALADDFDNLADTALRLASIIAGALVGKSVALGIAQFALLAKVVLLLVGSFGGAAAAAGGLAGAASVLSGALFRVSGVAVSTATSLGILRGALFGLALGPIGALIGGVAVYFLTMSDSVEKATETVDTHRASLEQMKSIKGQLPAVIDENSRALYEEARQLEQNTTKQYENAKAAVAAAEARLVAAQTEAAAQAENPAGGPGYSVRNQPRLRAASEAFRAKEALAAARVELEAFRKNYEALGLSVPASAPTPTPAGKISVGAGKPKKEPKGKAEKLTDAERDQKAAKEYIADLHHERELIGLTAEQQEVLNALRRLGAGATGEQRDKVYELVAATIEERQANERLVESMDEVRTLARDALGTFVSGLREGKSAAESLGDAIGRIGDKLLDIALDQTIAALFGKGGTAGGGTASGLGSLLSTLFGGGRASGGPVSAGNLYRVNERGGPEYFRPNTGGQVIPLGRGGGGGVVNFAPVIDARGADVAAVARLTVELQQMKASLPSVISGQVGNMQRRGR